MRILILQDYLRCGGTERQSVFLSQYFHAQGNHVGLLTFRPGGALAAELTDELLRPALQSRDTSWNWFAPGLFRAIYAERPDVVLCMGRMANSYGGLIKRRFPSLSVISTARTGKALPLSNLWSFRQVDGVLTNSAWWRARLIERNIDPAKIAVISNGLAYAWDGKRREEARWRMRQQLGISPSTVVFLNVADFRRGKRHDLLVDIFASLDPEWDWQLRLVGDGKEWRRVNRRVSRLIDSGRIHLIGHRANPYACYAAADVAVSVSIEDSLPNFLVEAQTVGLPVIATDYRGVGEGMRHGETGYLIGTNDHKGFVDAVHRLYLDSELRRTLGGQASAFAAEHCSSDQQAMKLLEALRFFHARVPMPVDLASRQQESPGLR